MNINLNLDCIYEQDSESSDESRITPSINNRYAHTIM